jgi:hypothetical protein
MFRVLIFCFGNRSVLDCGVFLSHVQLTIIRWSEPRIRARPPERGSNSHDNLRLRSLRSDLQFRKQAFVYVALCIGAFVDKTNV